MATVEVDVKKLLEAGAHFGHKTSRWHPKMAQYIHSKRNGTHIIDLIKTTDKLEAALDFLYETVAQGKQVLLVGTKRQAHDKVKEVAVATDMPYVVERWLGGMLTNNKTIGGRVKHLKDLESKMASGQLASRYNKLELQRFQEEIDQLNFVYGGVKDMVQRPAAIFIIDVVHEDNAIREAKKLNIPVVALVDTNADPTQIAYPVPCNDDALKTIDLVLGYVQQAIDAGKAKRQKQAKPDKDEA